MSLGVDPVVSNLFFSLSLIPHFSRVRTARTGPRQTPLGELPFVSIIVALFEEKPEDIEATLSSLIHQTYPRERCEIIFAVEPDDQPTLDGLMVGLERLTAAGIVVKTVTSDGKSRSKPYALNQAIRHATGEYCVFYDAADRIPSDQIERGVSLVVNGDYDLAQAKVLREGKSLLSRFLLLDTALWFWKSVPAMLRLGHGFPLSGEGLFVKRSVLLGEGGFPDVLTEDALLGLNLSAKGKRFALLDSTTVEKAPRNIRAHFRQKMRWHRGYLTCLRQLFAARMPWRSRAAFLLPFCTPITSSLAFFGWLLILFNLLAPVLIGSLQISFPWMESAVYASVLRYWSLFLAYFGIPLSILSTVHVAWRLEKLNYAVIIPLLPVYWIFVGFCATCSFFRGTSDWGKTER